MQMQMQMQLQIHTLKFVFHDWLTLLIRSQMIRLKVISFWIQVERLDSLTYFSNQHTQKTTFLYAIMYRNDVKGFGPELFVLERLPWLDLSCGQKTNESFLKRENYFVV